MERLAQQRLGGVRLSFPGGGSGSRLASSCVWHRGYRAARPATTALGGSMSRMPAVPPTSIALDPSTFNGKQEGSP